MKKRKFLLITIICLALSLCACGGSTTSQSTNTAASTKAEKNKKKKSKKNTKTSGDEDAPAFQKKRTQILSDEELDKLPQKKVEQVNYVEISAQREIQQAIDTADAGNPQEAIKLLEAVTVKDPKAFLALFNLAVLYEWTGAYPKANATYRNCLAADPTYVPALLNLIRLELREKQNAIATANEYIVRSPDIFEYQYAKIEALIGSQRYEEAIDIIRRLLKTDEASSRLRYYMALAEFYKERYELSLYILQQALSITTEDPEIYFLLSLVQRKLDQSVDSLKSVTRALELRPDYLEAQWLKGIIDYDTRGIDEAESSFRRMLLQNPTLPETYLNLGNVLKTQRKGDEAESYLKKALELAPNSGDVKFALGALYFNVEPLPLASISGMERLQLAKKYFLEAQDLMTNKTDKATAKDMVKKTDKAMEILQAELDAAELENAFSDDGFGDSAAEEF